MTTAYEMRPLKQHKSHMYVNVYDTSSMYNTNVRHVYTVIYVVARQQPIQSKRENTRMW